MSLRKFKMGNLGKKLEILNQAKQKIEDEIDEVVGEKKSKIKRTSLKKAK